MQCSGFSPIGKVFEITFKHIQLSLFHLEDGLNSFAMRLEQCGEHPNKYILHGGIVGMLQT